MINIIFCDYNFLCNWSVDQSKICVKVDFFMALCNHHSTNVCMRGEFDKITVALWYFFLDYWHCDFFEVLKWSFCENHGDLSHDYANLTVNPDMHFVQFTFVNCYGGIIVFLFCFVICLSGVGWVSYS